jgi:hypothetical protein
MALLNWTELGEYSYRQISLYDMEWEDELDLEHFYVVASKFGGPIARVMKPKSLIMGIVHDN